MVILLAMCIQKLPRLIAEDFSDKQSDLQCVTYVMLNDVNLIYITLSDHRLAELTDHATAKAIKISITKSFI